MPTYSQEGKVWSSHTPQKPGSYLHKNLLGEILTVEVENNPARFGRMRVPYGGKYHDAADLRGEWSGPLYAPGEHMHMLHDHMRTLPPGQRVELFSKIAELYCPTCGLEMPKTGYCCLRGIKRSVG